jgi:periodic tryptophan protein 1
MISSLAWIPKGAAAAVPEYAQIPEEELEALRDAAAAEGEREVRAGA